MLDGACHPDEAPAEAARRRHPRGLPARRFRSRSGAGSASRSPLAILAYPIPHDVQSRAGLPDPLRPLAPEDAEDMPQVLEKVSAPYYGVSAEEDLAARERRATAFPRPRRLSSSSIPRTTRSSRSSRPKSSPTRRETTTWSASGCSRPAPTACSRPPIAHWTRAVYRGFFERWADSTPSGRPRRLSHERGDGLLRSRSEREALKRTNAENETVQKADLGRTAGDHRTPWRASSAHRASGDDLAAGFQRGAPRVSRTPPRRHKPGTTKTGR